MTLIIGLTGGIGCGKSTVSSFFSELNIRIIDADLIARLVVAKGQPALKKIEAHFGLGILTDGTLNRGLLRDLIFQDDHHKAWLNNLLHPLIRTEIKRLLAAAEGPYVLLEAPLLFENNLDDFSDYDLVVDLDPKLQLQRASVRDGVSVKSIKAIMDSQIQREQRLDKADFVINNNGVSLQTLKNRVVDLDKQFRSLQKKLK
ncbi:dephospho-CoA kinase [Psychromonas antarctica]|jgi:dephospho-CoA kinase|uniref:dephospho-CoA kinase n=1 Tax=Psychromonas antarctica TaxID=67573 RepID=UPI001EE97A57|nr:dephospho-CoA kinase [Psychromonas antarctica]MCG6200902.1 dephospho-CoA kinase [Psychromonas antarctica]